LIDQFLHAAPRFLNNSGIRTNGVGGLFINPADANAHGLNEKLRVDALYEGQSSCTGSRRFSRRPVSNYASTYA
jgi:hypothetical protein